MVPQVLEGDLSAEHADAVRAGGSVAVDTETSGLAWDQDHLHLCQLYARSTDPILVRVSDEIPERLLGLMEDPALEKIFHHAPFDLRFIMHRWSVEPRSIRCTKVASKLLFPAAPNVEHSLVALAAKLLGVTIEKGAVRTSDWGSAELTHEQISYATDDVRYLPDLYQALRQRLESADLRQTYDACCTFLPTYVELELGGYPDVFAY